MGTVRFCEKLLEQTSVLIRRNLVMVGERRNIKKKKRLYETVSLSPEQEQEIQLFYQKHYGKRISTKWHRLYTSYTGEFCYNYFPEYLLSSRLEPMLNRYREAEFLGDKNLLPLLFGTIFAGVEREIHVPQTIVSCIKGILQDGDHCVISEKDAERIITNHGKCVIKKTIDTSSGRDVEIISPQEMDIPLKLKSFGNNYVVQELIEQSDELKELNPSSVNTFRVMTYFCNGKVDVCPVALRIGRAKADRDNIHYGGIAIGVSEIGTLKKTAFSEYGERFNIHPDTSIVFENYLISEAGTKIRETAKMLHCRVPYLGIISWDLTIDKHGRPTLIEMNTTGQSAWFSQMVNGEPLFGENTGKMLEMIRK